MAGNIILHKKYIGVMFNFKKKLDSKKEYKLKIKTIQRDAETTLPVVLKCPFLELANTRVYFPHQSSK